MENNWISIKEKLPDAGERVLVTDGIAVFEQYIKYRFIDHGEMHWDRYDGVAIITNPTHWMQMPKPPKSGDLVE